MSRPVFVLVAGVNGAGKSIFAQSPDALAHAADLYFNGTFSAHCAAKTVDGTRITVPPRCPDILRFLVSGLLVEP